MRESPLLDAAAGFLRILRSLPNPTPGEILAAWERFYGQAFPELHGKQIQDYTGAGQDWREIALTRVFPPLPERLELMEEARTRLARLWGEVAARARRVLGLEQEVAAIVHVGIGCRAGWAMMYQGKPAVLFGLENIAELGWQAAECLEGLIAHELGHVAHHAWRGEPLEPVEEDPLGILYTEGFAQRMEDVILGRESWHLSPDREWLPWCRAHLREIARAYRDRAIRAEAVNPFFGSWLSYQGVPFTGHFLGHAAIGALEQDRSLAELARLPLAQVQASMDGLLRKLEAGRTTALESGQHASHPQYHRQANTTLRTRSHRRSHYPRPILDLILVPTETTAPPGCGLCRRSCPGSVAPAAGGSASVEQSAAASPSAKQRRDPAAGRLFVLGVHVAPDLGKSSHRRVKRDPVLTLAQDG